MVLKSSSNSTRSCDDLRIASGVFCPTIQSPEEFTTDVALKLACPLFALVERVSCSGAAPKFHPSQTQGCFPLMRSLRRQSVARICARRYRAAS